MDRILKRLWRVSLTAAMAAMVLQIAPPAAAQDNVADGRRVFAANCAMCHMAVANGHTLLGPNLYGVVGRRAGSVPGFAYSPAMQHAAFDWTPEQIEAFVRHPAQVVPGTRMMFAGLRNPQQVDALVAYLRTLQPPAGQ